MTSQTTENYLKAIFKLSELKEGAVSTNSIAAELSTSPASVTDMLKKLSDRKFLNYEKYKGVSLTDKGLKLAVSLIRRHRLWEVFLVDKLHFSWDEVHEVAEELEHIDSEKLVRQLDAFLGYPKFDPHGGAIPDEHGHFTVRNQVLLSEMDAGSQGVLVGVQEDSRPFLQYLDRLKLRLGVKVELLEKFDFDESINIRIDGESEALISNKVSQNLFIKKS